MGASLSNPHFLAFADHYNDARDAGRAPMTWRQFLDTRALGPADDAMRIFRDRALGRHELKAIRLGVEATLPAAPAASDLVAPYDLTPGREYNAPPMDDY